MAAGSIPVGGTMNEEPKIEMLGVSPNAESLFELAVQRFGTEDLTMIRTKDWMELRKQLKALAAGESVNTIVVPNAIWAETI